MSFKQCSCVQIWRALQANSDTWTADEVTNKPWLLQRMEEFLHKELGLLNGMYDGEVPPVEAQLEVYRQCFRVFMEHFTTYRPILSTIIHCYESVIDRARGGAHLNGMTPVKVRMLEDEYSKHRLVLQVCAALGLG